MKDIRAAALRFEPVGSRVTCNPPPMDTDEDFLVLVTPATFNEFEAMLFCEQFEFGGSRVRAGGCILGDNSSFQSYTRGEVNLIVTASELFFDRFMQATAQAKTENLLEKSARIALFQSILYPANALNVALEAA